MARTYFERLNILITRPFNYTGVGQNGQFLIPKIVKHFREEQREIELGNLDVVRDFSDVRFVAGTYKKFMECNETSEIVNICSGTGISLMEIISRMNALAGYEITTKINPIFVRKNELKTLIGSNDKLISLIHERNSILFEDTLRWMLSQHSHHKCNTALWKFTGIANIPMRSANAFCNWTMILTLRSITVISVNCISRIPHLSSEIFAKIKKRICQNLFFKKIAREDPFRQNS
jgi:hypothetical protein